MRCMLSRQYLRISLNCVCGQTSRVWSCLLNLQPQTQVATSPSPAYIERRDRDGSHPLMALGIRLFPTAAEAVEAKERKAQSERDKALHEAKVEAGTGESSRDPYDHDRPFDKWADLSDDSE